jgi:hypothetical protein
MKKAIVLLTAALAVAGCDNKTTEEKPASAKDDKLAEKTGDKADETPKADEPKEGDTKPAKTDTDNSVEAKVIAERSTKLLQALKDKKVDDIATFVAADQQDQIKTDFAEGGKAHKSFFGEGEWRWKAINAWDGKVHEVRINDDEARAKFGETEQKQAAVVVWKKKDDAWLFEDVNSPSLEDFAKWGEVAAHE